MRRRGFEVVADKFRKHPEVEIKKPVRADVGACGYDIHSPVNVVIYPNESVLIWTDIKAYMKEEEVLVANTRSGNGAKHGIVLRNTNGWIDSTYYENPSNDGNIGICLLNTGDEPFRVNAGDRIAQLMFQKYFVADEDITLHMARTGGFGSSGR